MYFTELKKGRVFELRNFVMEASSFFVILDIIYFRGADSFDKRTLTVMNIYNEMFSSSIYWIANKVIARIQSNNLQKWN